MLVSRESPGELARRLRELSRHPALSGKLLAAWSLGGPVRVDLPGSLLGEGTLGGIGVAEWSIVGLRTAERQLAEFGGAISTAGPNVAPPSVERRT